MVQIKTGYFDWKETEKAKKFVKAMQAKKMKVYMLEENGDAYPLIAAKSKPTPSQLVGVKSGGYESNKPHRYNASQARLPLTEVKPQDFDNLDDNKSKQTKYGKPSFW
jgi:hypothetical protein